MDQLQDKADDILIGVKSTALRFGDNTKTWLTGFAAVTISGLGTAGYLADQTWPFYAALAGIFSVGHSSKASGTAAHLTWQIGTVDINNGTDCWQKFRSNSWMGAILFTGIVLGNLLKEEKTTEETDIEEDK